MPIRVGCVSLYRQKPGFAPAEDCQPSDNADGFNNAFVAENGDKELLPEAYAGGRAASVPAALHPDARRKGAPIRLGGGSQLHFSKSLTLWMPDW